MASSSRELVTEPAVSKGEPDIAPATEALRIDKLLSETASDDLIKTGASSATTRVSSMEPIEDNTTVEGTLEDITEGTIGAMSVMTSAPFGNIIVICKRPLLDIIIFLSLF